jgi:hypothetical protein
MKREPASSESLVQLFNAASEAEQWVLTWRQWQRSASVQVRGKFSR